MIFQKKSKFLPQNFESGLSKWLPTGRTYFYDLKKKSKFSPKISKTAIFYGRQRAGHIFIIFPKKVNFSQKM
jgi:hypothetical protein